MILLLFPIFPSLSILRSSLTPSPYFVNFITSLPPVLMTISIVGEIVVFRNSHKLDLYGLKEENEEEDEEQGKKEKELMEGEEAIPLTKELMDDIKL